jgi:hypothetical protein
MAETPRPPFPSDRALTELGLFFALLGIAGVGVPMIWPDQRAIGILFFVVGVGGCIVVAILSLVRLILSKKARLGTVLASIGTILIIAGTIIGLVGAFLPDKERVISRALMAEVYLDEQFRVPATVLRFTNRRELEQQFDKVASAKPNAYQYMIPQNIKSKILNVIVRNVGKEEIPQSKVTITALIPFNPITEGFMRSTDRQASWNAPSLPDYSLLGRENYYSLEINTSQVPTQICLWILIEAPTYNPYAAAACLRYVYFPGQ